MFRPVSGHLAHFLPLGVFQSSTSQSWGINQVTEASESSHVAYLYVLSTPCEDILILLALLVVTFSSSISQSIYKYWV